MTLEKGQPGRYPNVPYFKDPFPSKNNKIGVKGVYWLEFANKWTAKVKAFGEEVYLGIFDDVAEAEKALDKVRNELNTKEDVEKFKANQNSITGRDLNKAYFKNDEPSKNNKSGVKGVYWHKRDKKWRAILTIHGRKVTVGHFDNVPEAEKAINEARKIYQ